MAKPVRSARGTLVDFDLIKIKQQMESVPKEAPVQARENFIDQRAKRRLNRATAAITATPVVVPEISDAVETEIVSDPITPSKNKPNRPKNNV